jgi:hypothetical protein
MAAVPAAWQDGPAPVGRALAAPQGGVWLAIEPGRLDGQSLIADAGPHGPLFGAPQKSPDAALVHFPVIGGKGKEGLVGKSLTITFTTPAGAFEVVRQVEAPGPS